MTTPPPTPPPPDDLLQHLLRKALDLPPAARAAFVTGKCGDDHDLLRHLCARLVAAGDESFRSMATPPPPPSPAPPPPAPPPAPTRPIPHEGPGSVLGPYRLLQSIGEGGFGTVFLAQQTEPVQRQVALKVVKLGMDTAQVVARFEQERQALAVLDHPHIAKVFDAGSTATGRPYFVMELCRGEPLTDYCDKNQLTIDARLALFEQICHAVQHAHGKGIIHRDLKPSNVLVGSQDGVPHAKVIDFGIAKATSQKLTDRTLFTEAQQVIGTLQYMSPEQAEGSLDIDTRADVYSLGAILYELLTGTTPVDRRTLREAAFGEVQRLIRDVEPLRPSTRISDSRELLATIAAQRRLDEKRLPALVRGELDWIVMRAIEKDRTRRYATANGLALDVARFRRGEPVEAAPPSTSYRLRKFVRRHRGPVVAAALVVLALLGGITGTLWGLFEAQEQERLASRRADAENEQRRRADDERERAVRFRDQALDALRATTGEDVEKLIGSRTELSARERAYLEAIAQRWLAFAEQAGTDVESRELRAEGLAQVAMLRRSFDDPARVRAGLEESLATWTRLGDEFPDRIRYQRERVGVRLQLAQVLTTLGDDEAAAAQFRGARELAEELVARFPEHATFRFLLAQAHSGLGLRLQHAGQHAAARTEIQRARDLEQALAAAAPDEPAYARALALTRNNLAVLLTVLGEREAALAEYEATRAIELELVVKTPDDPALRASAANSLQNVATVLSELGHADRAKAAYRTAIAELERLAGDFPAVPTHQNTLARTRAKLGSLLHDLGEHDAAQTEYAAARERQQQLVTRHAAVPEYQSDLARTEYRLAMLAASRGDSDRAIEHYGLARDRYLQLVAAQPDALEHRHNLADTHNQLGITLVSVQRFEAAEAAFVASRDLALQMVAAHPGLDELESCLGNARNSLGMLYRRQGRRHDAQVEVEAARDVRQRVAQRSPQVMRYQIMLGGSHCNVGQLLLETDPTASLRSFDEAIAVLRPLHEREPRNGVAREFLRNGHLGRARAHSALRHWADAAADFDHCVPLTQPQDRTWLLHQATLARVRAGDIESALAEADAQAAANAGAEFQLFAARAHALAAAASSDRRQEFADRAMALLQQAVQAGLREPAKLQADADFAPLRERADFQQLVGGPR
jgi:serine/threonine protein kinase/tetratricopeptide (TPR) repeat protein